MVVHDFQLGWHILVAISVDGDQVLFELVLGDLEEAAGVADLASDSVEVSEELVTEVVDLEAGAHEGVTDLLDSVLDHLTVLVDYHVNDLALLVLSEGRTEVGQGLTTGDTEEHALHS